MAIVADRTQRLLRSTTIAAFLGLGAPIGYLFYSYYAINPKALPFFEHLAYLWEQEFPLLMYLTFPTVLVFSLFGFTTGLQNLAILRSKNQMEEFIHIAAHDIKGPLGSIARGIGMLPDCLGENTSKSGTQLVQVLNRQILLLMDLVTELLDIHKMESGTFRLETQEIDPREVLEKAIAEVSALFEEKATKVQVKLDIAPTKAILGDSFRIRQVLRNVLTNAGKFVTEGGLISCTISQEHDGMIEFKIANEGSNIPEDKLSSIFDKFAQAQNREQKLGYGLGLAICKNIMDLHKGRIWAENLSPAGVCIHIQFPRS